MYKRLYNYVEKHQILSEHQFGFRRNRSTEHAIHELLLLLLLLSLLFLFLLLLSLLLLWAGYLGKGTEGNVFAAQEQALRTRFFRATIERKDVDPKRRVCCKEVESVGHVASGCGGLA